MQEYTIAFSGGDNLTGTLSLYNKILMKNELNNGYGAYQLSLANYRSGLSFGGNQMDMSEETNARQLFLDIIENAIDEDNNKFFTNEEYTKIKFHTPISSKGLPPIRIFGTLLSKVNAALSSKYGITQINAQYIKEITIDANHIENVVQNLINPLTKSFYNTELGKALLFDYNNQFYLAPHGELKMYLDGYKIITFTKKPLIVMDSYTLQNHKEFLFDTKEGQENKPDVVRRINNIIGEVS